MIEVVEYDEAWPVRAAAARADLISLGVFDAVEHIGPALVTVNGRARQSASGVVYKQDTILTADHVLEREEDLTIITQDGRTLLIR